LEEFLCLKDLILYLQYHNQVVIWHLGLLIRESISLCFILGFYPRPFGILDPARLLGASHQLTLLLIFVVHSIYGGSFLLIHPFQKEDLSYHLLVVVLGMTL
jgi:hypothetical protein